MAEQAPSEPKRMPTFEQQPLIYRMLSRVQLPPELAYDEAYAAVFRELRRYSAASIVHAALRLLWAKYPNEVDALQSAPWHILLLVKWAMKDRHVRLRVGPPISPDAFDGLRQRVLDLQGLEHRLRPAGNAFLMLRAHLTQIDFQREQGWGFLRWPALIARQPERHPSHRQFLAELGLPPSHFMDLAYGLSAAVLGGELPMAPTWFDPFRQAYGTSVDRMLELVSRDFVGLRDELQTEARIKGRQELYEFPYLKRFPFVRLRDGRLHCWHPLVFARGLEDLVHLRLSRLHTEYTQPFSRLFEQYVIELTQQMAPSALNEDEYRKAAGPSAPTVEAAVACDDCNIFVEAKMSLFTDDVLLTDNETQAHHKTKRVRDGIKQAWRVGVDLRNGTLPFPRFRTAKEDFLLVVTSRELFIGGGEMLRRLYAKDTFTYPDDGCFRNLPLSNVFVVSIEDFERLVCCVSAGEASLPAVMKAAAAANRDVSTSSLMFSNFLTQYASHWGLSPLLVDARGQAQSRIAAAFGLPAGSFDDVVV